MLVIVVRRVVREGRGGVNESKCVISLTGCDYECLNHDNNQALSSSHSHVARVNVEYSANNQVIYSMTRFVTAYNFNLIENIACLATGQ